MKTKNHDKKAKKVFCAVWKLNNRHIASKVRTERDLNDCVNSSITRT